MNLLGRLKIPSDHSRNDNCLGEPFCRCGRGASGLGEIVAVGSGGTFDLREILLACNRRYIAHLSALDDFSAGIRALDRLTKPREVDGKTIQGINFFAPVDKALLHALQDPKVNIAGIRRRDLLADLAILSPTRLSRQLRRLLNLGVFQGCSAPSTTADVFAHPG